jgi:predicted O-methyltransferase YrrM
MKGYSSDFLQNAESEHYDFIYIDGDHRADEVYKDAIFGWRCLKKGGIMAFDDYRWVHDSKDPQMAPQPGIDKFLSEYSNDLSIMAKDLQVWVYKNE